ncbi:hypothetical protein AAD018_009750 [Aestuariibius insulae]|uniref:hypothetical protein n=1 Tax=Aestuariibius insulae TaxID=2058287 RepID=UPI00345EEA53
MISRFLFSICFLGLVGCAELDGSMESGDRALSAFEVSQDRVYLAVPTRHQLGFYSMFFRPVNQAGQFQGCGGIRRCAGTVAFGFPIAAGEQQIFITGPSGIQYRVMSTSAGTSGLYAFADGVQSSGISQSDISPRTKTMTLNLSPGTVHVIGNNADASAAELAEVQSALRGQYGAAAASLTYRSVEERPIVCEQQSVASEMLVGRRTNCRLQ